MRTTEPVSSPMIVVVGEALVDLIVHRDGRLAAVPGGGPYNTARAIARLRVPVAWAGGLSSDVFGQRLEAGLVRDGVSLDLVQRRDEPTTLALAELDSAGAATYRFYVDGTAAPRLELEPLLVALPRDVRAIHLGTLGLVLEPMAGTVDALMSRLPDDAVVMLDPNSRPSITADPAGYRARVDRLLRRADIVKVSGDDLAFLRPDLSTREAARWVASRGPSVVLLTDGPDAVVVVAGDREEVIPVPPVDVVDTVGAGDTFGGALLAWLVHEGPGPDRLADPSVIGAATRFGIRAAGIVCQRAGADPPTIGDLGGWPAPG